MFKNHQNIAFDSPRQILELEIMQISHGHQIFLQKKVVVVRHQLMHDLWATNGIVHEMELPFQNQELIKLRAVVNKPVFFPLTDDGRVVVVVQLKGSLFGYVVLAPISLL
jgi:hypothetical protein